MNRIFSNQKGGTLLCYVPDGAEAPKVAGICALLKIKYKELGSEALDKHIGFLLTGQEVGEEYETRARTRARSGANAGACTALLSVLRLQRCDL